MASDGTEREPGVYVLEETERHTHIKVIPEKRQPVEQPKKRTGQSRLNDSWGCSEDSETEHDGGAADA